MISESDLRQLGLCRRQAQRRLALAQLLGKDCTREILDGLLAEAKRQVPEPEAPSLLTTWLEDGSWRERWNSRAVTLRAAEAKSYPQHELEHRIVCEVISDRRTIERVAGDYGMQRDEVLEIVVRAAGERGIGEERLQEILGIAPPRRRPFAKQLPAMTAPAPAWPSAEQLQELYRKAGRKAPTHVLDGPR